MPDVISFCPYSTLRAKTRFKRRDSPRELQSMSFRDSSLPTKFACIRLFGPEPRLFRHRSAVRTSPALRRRGALCRNPWQSPEWTPTHPKPSSRPLLRPAAPFCATKRPRTRPASAWIPHTGQRALQQKLLGNPLLSRIGKNHMHMSRSPRSQRSPRFQFMGPTPKSNSRKLRSSRFPFSPFTPAGGVVLLGQLLQVSPINPVCASATCAFGAPLRRQQHPVPYWLIRSRSRPESPNDNVRLNRYH